jgi:chromate reductase
MTVRILAFAGSLRRDSLNRKLVAAAAEGAKAAGAEVTLLDLNDYPLPIYNGDDEAATGLPENARKLKQAFRDHDGFLISSPEYNGGFPGMLKNLTDWLSRAVDGEKPFEIWRDKPVVAMSASPGALGGNRMMAMFRAHLLHLQMIVLPDVMGLGAAKATFDEAGRITDDATRERVEKLGARVAEFAKRLKA